MLKNAIFEHVDLKIFFGRMPQHPSTNPRLRRSSSSPPSWKFATGQSNIAVATQTTYMYIKEEETSRP